MTPPESRADVERTMRLLARRRVATWGLAVGPVYTIVGCAMFFTPSIVGDLARIENPDTLTVVVTAIGAGAILLHFAALRAIPVVHRRTAHLGAAFVVAALALGGCSTWAFVNSHRAAGSIQLATKHHASLEFGAYDQVRLVVDPRATDDDLLSVYHGLLRLGLRGVRLRLGDTLITPTGLEAALALGRTRELTLVGSDVDDSYLQFEHADGLTKVVVAAPKISLSGVETFRRRWPNVIVATGETIPPPNFIAPAPDERFER